MTDKYQKDSQAASFKKHKEILAPSGQISMVFVVAELNHVILKFTDVKAVTGGWRTCHYCPCEAHICNPRTPGTEMVTWENRSQPRGEPQSPKRVIMQKGQKRRG